MMVLRLVWVKLMVPEIEGRSLEDIQRDLGVSEVILNQVLT